MSSEYIEQIYDSVSVLVWWLWAAAHVGSLYVVWKQMLLLPTETALLETYYFKSQQRKMPKFQWVTSMPQGPLERFDIYRWRVCGLTEWFKRKINTYIFPLLFPRVFGQQWAIQVSCYTDNRLSIQRPCNTLLLSQWHTHKHTQIFTTCLLTNWVNIH